MSQDRRKQDRFLAAYGDYHNGLWNVAAAARAARVHRASVYRWRTDPDFAARMDAAGQDAYTSWRRAVYAPQEAARRAEKCRRNALNTPTWRANLAKARAAKRGKLKGVL